MERSLGRTLPAGRVIGESWEVVDRPEARSVVARGPHAGRSLRELVETAPEALVGPGWDGARPFPILVKWLDCRERLSLQVHPPAAVAERLGGEPKTENWYVAAAVKDASLIVGLKRGVTRDGFERGIREGTLEDLVHRFPVKAGDSILVESGRLHAIDAGNLILEIQQNSDTTYRVYDWGRVGLDGKPRQLHVAQSMESIDFEDFEPGPLRASAGDAVLAECREFRIRRFERAAGEAFPAIRDGAGAALLHVVKGAVEVACEGGSVTIRAGENAILPADHDHPVSAVAPAVVLVTDRFGA